MKNQSVKLFIRKKSNLTRFMSRFESIYHMQDPIKQDQCYDDLFSEILKVGVSND